MDAQLSQTEDDIIQEIVDRFKAAQEWEGYTRPLNLDDEKFGLADSDNGYQWPDAIAANRQLGNMPMLTINKTHQHCLQIINDAKQNKVACKVAPVGDEATKEAADVYEGIIRHIEYQSNAQDVYIQAVKKQVYIGMGYWRITTRYIDDRSFDQEIYITPVKDPFTVYLDPDIQEIDGSDATWGLFFKDLPRHQFDLKYPKLKDKVTADPLGELTAGQVAEKHVRIAEYYRRVPKRDKLIALADGSTALRSVIGPEIYAKLKEDPEVKIRPITSHEVEWFKVAGGNVVEKGKWPSQYIPIVRVPGEESVIGGQYDRRGHVRALKDPQRMYNYWTSSAVENVALQSKSPYVGPMEAFDGLETYWNAANKSNLAWLPYNGRDDTGQEIAQPTRQEPPSMGQAYMEGLQIAANEMQMVSGQYQAQMGEQSNERSGIAIQQRQRQGDNATYGFIDSLASAIRYTGRILIDMIPQVYDTERVIQILAENGDQSTVHIDPQQKAPLQTAGNGDAVHQIFNPSVGRYSVEADVGPSFGTRRQETFNALAQIIAAAPELMNKAGDLLFKSADFPMAEEIAERLKPGISPQEAQLQQQLQKMQQLLGQTMQELSQEKAKRTTQEQQKGIDAYRAETDRLALFKDIDPTILIPVGRQSVVESLSNPLKPIDASVDQAIGNMATPTVQPPQAAQPTQPQQ